MAAWVLASPFSAFSGTTSAPVMILSCDGFPPSRTFLIPWKTTSMVPRDSNFFVSLRLIRPMSPSTKEHRSKMACTCKLTDSYLVKLNGTVSQRVKDSEVKYTCSHKYCLKLRDIGIRTHVGCRVHSCAYVNQVQSPLAQWVAACTF